MRNVCQIQEDTTCRDMCWYSGCKALPLVHLTPQLISISSWRLFSNEKCTLNRSLTIGGKKNMLLGHWYSDWCEVTPLMVISCRGPSSLCCFYSGRRSALAESSPPSPYSGSRQWKVARPGPRGALLCYTSFQLSIVSSSVRASGHRVGQRGVY